MFTRKPFLYFAFGFLSCLIIFSTVYKSQQFQIDKDSVKTAMQLYDLNFTEAQIDSMMDGLQADLMNFMTLRELQIPNEIPPALYFNPIPPGVALNFDEPTEIEWEFPETELPENHDDLAFYSIPQLAYLIKNRKLSSVDLTHFFLNRLEQHGYELEAVITITRERALQQAAALDRELGQGIWRGPLHGIPYGAKDLLTVEGYKTTWGAMPYKDQEIDDTATIIKKLDEAGAVLVAKLTLGALAWGDVWYDGVTKNPWNPEQGASGSSAGSGASVAAGLVPFGLGTETLGSIISPATRNGVTGLRPTFGRVSRSGAMALSWSMDKIGPMTRSVEDAAIVFDAIKGSDGKDLSLIDAGFAYQQQADINNIRVGYLASAFEEEYEYAEQDQQVLMTMEALGVELIPIELPQFPLGALSIILSAEAATAFDDLTLSGDVDSMVRQEKNAWPNVFRTARFTPAVEYIQANRARTMYMMKFHEIFDDVDVIITPSFVGGTILATNLTGHPAVVMKNGYGNDGSPSSFTIIGKLFGEAELLHLAGAWQNATEFHLQHPPGF